MRTDRFITLNFAWPLVRVLRKGDSGRRLPILMYHSISEARETSAPLYYGLATNPRRFADQMRWLAERGCKAVSLEEALCHASDGQAREHKIVALTFDDGFRNFLTAAWPVLQCHRFSATVYLPTNYISKQRSAFKGYECMTWSEVRELRKAGVRFGSHTASHPELYKMRWRTIERELAVSKRKLDDELGEEVTSFAYPYAFPQEDASFTNDLALLLREIGYERCVTTAIGRDSPDSTEFFLKRLPVNSCDDRSLFGAKLDGAYDWMGSVQLLYRKFKQKRRASE